MEKIENVVFDLGGVVIGRDYDRYGAEIAEFSFLQGDRPFPEWWKRYDLGTASRSEVVEAVSAECGLGPEQAAAKLDRLMYLFNEFGDTAELIRELSAKGYGLYVCVTAMSSGRVPSGRVSPSSAARIISIVPAACTLVMSTSSRASTDIAFFTVLGISCSLRSRNIR